MAGVDALTMVSMSLAPGTASFNHWKFCSDRDHASKSRSCCWFGGTLGAKLSHVLSFLGNKKRSPTKGLLTSIIHPLGRLSQLSNKVF